MKFGAVPVADAAGAVLAHSIRPGGGARIAKGTLLEAAHLDRLTEAGITSVVVARLEVGDVPEDGAAERLAQAIVTDATAQGLRISGAGAGRVNLYAQSAGVTVVNARAIAAINASDPMITIATVPEYHRVDAGGMVATIKIISYAVPEAALTRACAHAAHALRIQAPQFASATLIETSVGGETPSDKGRGAMAGRLDRMGVALGPRTLIGHDEAALSQAINAATGEVILILTGSATSDPDDVAPTALRQAGGTVERFGMPVDPGNLLFLGSLGRKPVIGLPGCARSPALNGADWVLERVLCGIAVTSQDIASMGVGGLLKEIPTRPMPRRGG